ncbi:MAG TPA: ScyD/ScyE family protein [Actinomycetota bacterium]|jgi:hypothetical protein|nr:ScyD/ScyE family protein [Actinomycetota bacterium]
MRRTFVAVTVALSVVASAAAAGAVVMPPFQVVMSGLDNPRGLAWGPEGALYVAEAGRGGEQFCGPGPEGRPASAGLTGAVSRLWRGEQERVATGLPSHAAGPEGVAATGPHDIAMLGPGEARVSIGLGTNPANRALWLCPIGPQFGWLARMPASGNWRLETDVAAYEAEANPDGGLPDSNPYGLLAEPGSTVATDAGGNSLLGIRANGSTSTLAVFPSRSTGRDTDSVPTSVAVGPDRAYYVGELTGFPFTPSSANVWRVVPGQAPTVFEPGFSAIIDITFGPDGSLYVLEFATEPFLSGPGDLWRVSPNGTRSLVATGFTAPGSVAIGPDGAFYVSNCSIFPGTGPFPCNGEVVRIEG